MTLGEEEEEEEVEVEAVVCLKTVFDERIKKKKAFAH